MTLWEQINEKWNTLPQESTAESFKPRLMLHLAHALAAIGVALLGWQFIGELWMWCVGVNAFMFIREVVQNISEGETWWSCVFDTVQTLVVWTVNFLVEREWLLAGAALIVFASAYIFFLLRDEKWFYSEST
jgi:hypothetical protein